MNNLIMSAKQIDLQLDLTSIISYEDGIDDFDGPLWYDAMDAASVKLEAEGFANIHSQARHHHECASPVERVKHEEEHITEAIAALWESEQHSRESSPWIYMLCLCLIHE